MELAAKRDNMESMLQSKKWAYNKSGGAQNMKCYISPHITFRWQDVAHDCAATPECVAAIAAAAAAAAAANSSDDSSVDSSDDSSGDSDSFVKLVRPDSGTKRAAKAPAHGRGRAKTTPKKQKT